MIFFLFKIQKEIINAWRPKISLQTEIIESGGDEFKVHESTENEE